MKGVFSLKGDCNPHIGKPRWNKEIQKFPSVLACPSIQVTDWWWHGLLQKGNWKQEGSKGENTVCNSLKTPAPVVFLYKLQRACQDNFCGIMGKTDFSKRSWETGGGVGSVWKKEEVELWGCEIYQKITGYEKKGKRQFHGQIWEWSLNSPMSHMAIT